MKMLSLASHFNYSMHKTKRLQGILGTKLSINIIKDKVSTLYVITTPLNLGTFLVWQYKILETTARNSFYKGILNVVLLYPLAELESRSDPDIL